MLRALRQSQQEILVIDHTCGYIVVSDESPARIVAGTTRVAHRRPRRHPGAVTLSCDILALLLLQQRSDLSKITATVLPVRSQRRDLSWRGIERGSAHGLRRRGDG